MRFLLIIGFLFTMQSCTTVYYEVWEKLGKEKRDLLSRNIQRADKQQNQIEETFKDTLEEIRSKYNLKSPDIEGLYDELSGQYTSAKSQAEALHGRVDDVESVAKDLFVEWKKEALQITNPKLRGNSLKKLAQTKQKFSPLLSSMRLVEKKFKPVLTKLKDQVLYMKHNLNAKALGAFKREFGRIELDFKSLTNTIQASSKRAESFLDNLKE